MQKIVNLQNEERENMTYMGLLLGKCFESQEFHQRNTKNHDQKNNDVVKSEFYNTFCREIVSEIF